MNGYDSLFLSTTVASGKGKAPEIPDEVVEIPLTDSQNTYFVGYIALST